MRQPLEEIKMAKTTFQSTPNAGKGATIKCILCGFEKINDYPLTKKCSIRKKHKWREV